MFLDVEWPGVDVTKETAGWHDLFPSFAWTNMRVSDLVLAFLPSLASLLTEEIGHDKEERLSSIMH